VADELPRGAHVLVATMGDRDIEAIEAALRAPAYLGVVASWRFMQVRDTLLARGIARSRRIAAPGLDIGRARPGNRREHHGADRGRRRRAGAGGSRSASRDKPDAVDPVCGRRQVAARAAPRALGVTYYFAARLRTKFLADAARLAAGAGARSSEYRSPTTDPDIRKC
jgi:hypothetical protein